MIKKMNLVTENYKKDAHDNGCIFNLAYTCLDEDEIAYTSFVDVWVQKLHSLQLLSDSAEVSKKKSDACKITRKESANE